MNDQQIDEKIKPLIDNLLCNLDWLNKEIVETDNFKNYRSGYNDGMYRIGKELIKRIVEHQEITIGQIYISDLLKP